MLRRLSRLGVRVRRGTKPDQWGRFTPTLDRDIALLWDKAIDKVSKRNVKSIIVLDRGPRRTGVFFDFKGTSLYVTTQRHNLIRLTLKNPRRFNWALGKKTDQVIFDSLDQRAFLKAMETKAELTPASPTR